MMNRVIHERAIAFVLLLVWACVPAAAFDLYWTEGESIVASDIDGGNVTEVFDGTGMSDIAIDIRIADDRIYWTERNTGRIWSANRDGSEPAVFFDGGAHFSSLHFMEWDDENEKIFVSDFSAGIFEIDLGNEGSVRNVDGIGLSGYTGLALRGSEELVWLTATSSAIYSTDLTFAPNATETSLAGGSATYGLAYDAVADVVYYTNFNTGDLYAYNFSTGENPLLADGFANLLGVSLTPSRTHLILAERDVGISVYQIDNGQTARIVNREGVHFGVAAAADPEEIVPPEFLFYTDFQDGEANEAPGAPWTAVMDDPETDGTIRVRDDAEGWFRRGSGNRYLEFKDIGGSPIVLSASGAVAGSEDLATVSFDFVEPIASPGGEFVLNLYNESGEDGLIDRFTFQGGRLIGVSGLAYQPGLLNRVDLIVNMAEEAVNYGDQEQHALAPGSSDVWINGERVAAGYRDAAGGATGPLAGLDLRSSADAPVTIHLDDFGVRAGAHLSDLRVGIGEDPMIVFIDDFNSVEPGGQPTIPPWRQLDVEPSRGTAYVVQDTDNIFGRGTDFNYLDFHDPPDAGSAMVLWAHQTISNGPRVFTVSLHFHEPEDSVGNRFVIRVYDNDPDFWLGYRIDSLELEGGSIRNIDGHLYEKGRSYWLNWVINRSDEDVTYNNGQNTVPSFSSDVWIDDELVAAGFLHSVPTDLESTHLGGFDFRSYSNTSVRMFVEEIAFRSGAALYFPPAVEDVSGFEAWQSDHFTEEERGDPAVGGLHGDPAGDGVANYLKYALGLDPWTPSRSSDSLPRAEVVGGELHLTYTRRTDAPDIEFLIELSDDLIEWSDASGEIETVGIEDHGDTETVTVKTPGFPGEGNRGFARLRIVPL